MTPRDFLDLAEELIEGDTEAHWRSAVSRAYYAAFHVARLLLGRCGFRVPESDRSHKYLSDRLSNSGDKAVSRAGLDLDGLRDERNRADYDLRRRLSRRDADDLVEAARPIIETLEAAGADDAVRPAITQAMREYERGRGDVTWVGVTPRRRPSGWRARIRKRCAASWVGCSARASRCSSAVPAVAFSGA